MPDQSNLNVPMFTHTRPADSIGDEGLREALDRLIGACEGDSGLLGMALEDLILGLVDSSLRRSTVYRMVEHKAAWVAEIQANMQPVENI